MNTMEIFDRIIALLVKEKGGKMTFDVKFIEAEPQPNFEIEHTNETITIKLS